MSHAAPLSRPFSAAPAPAREVLGPATLVRGPMSLAETVLRIGIGLLWVLLCSLAFTVALFVLLPSRAARIKVGNVYGSFIGKGCAWLTGSRYTIEGREHANPARPAIYVANHASMVDIFLGAWLSPTGTCGVAKKEIIFYPFFGQFFVLAGHLRIDRGNHERAVASLRSLAELVKRYALSIFIWPEGHRSRDGRLRPFKKGAFHVALETGLPIVPMVIAGSHRAWEARSLRLARADVEVTFLPPIDTSAWRRETLDQHIAEVERVMAAALPLDQRPAVEAVASVARAA
ncbi:MAG: 1-acyl-sn-glycerol-3-phosphate acyltransferase [Deltaproteobacteria bacterium]|nr:1-acyl-sn-glycerol-3-phosphate acyltransferase [Deltaproteobacteria bacterium]